MNYHHVTSCFPPNRVRHASRALLTNLPPKPNVHYHYAIACLATSCLLVTLSVVVFFVLQYPVVHGFSSFGKASASQHRRRLRCCSYKKGPEPRSRDCNRLS